MKALEQIPVANAHDVETGMVLALLRELDVALQALMTAGTRHVIDLSALPLSPADQGALKTALGTGELHMDLEALGHSYIWETSVPGIWWVRHEGPDGRVLTEHIEVASVPEIVAAHASDLLVGKARLMATIERISSGRDT